MSSDQTAEEAAAGPSVVRIVLLVFAGVVGVWLVISQVLAVLPVAWVKPLLQNAVVQQGLIAVGGLRDGAGSWNWVIAVLAVLAAVVALRMGKRGTGKRRWFAGVVTAVTAVGLVLCVVTSTILVFAAHNVAGKWVLFAPVVPFRQIGKAPNQTVTYATIDGQPLQADLYLPENRSGAPVPLVVSIHGGAFIMGQRGTNPYTTWLAEQGYAVLDVDYRLAGKQVHRWDTEDADIGCAMTWANAHAAEYHWDTGKVATFGGSAGGNLAINTANKINAGTLQPSCGSAAELPKVRAAITLYPAVDLAASGTETAIGVQAADQYVGGTPQRYPDRYAAVDSAPHISQNTPPTLIVQGGGDHLVLADHSEAYADKLTAAGVPNRYIELPFYDHAFGGWSLDLTAQVMRPVLLSWLQQYL